MQSHDSPYRYSQLNPASADVRVFVADEHEPVSGRFEVVSLYNTHVEWDAISYAWENQTRSKSLVIGNSTIHVTPNVINILRALRSRRKYLWIDAICINQDDEEEKSSQVSFMRFIYQRARSVVLWLGSSIDKETENMVREAVEFVREQQSRDWIVSHGSLRDTFVAEKPQVRFTSPFHDLLNCGWFHRTWIIQEAVLPRRLRVSFNETEMPWDDLASTMLRFMSGFEAEVALASSLDICFTAIMEKNYYERTRYGLTTVHLLNCLRFWAHHSSLQLAPSELVHLCAKNEASLPSDKIYAVRGFFGLNQSGPYESFPIDYSMSNVRVYTDFTVWCIEREHSLDVLAQKQNEDGLPSPSRLPSWVTDWAATDRFILRASDFATLAARLDQPSVPLDHLAPRIQRFSGHLYVRGFTIDTIKDLYRVFDLETHSIWKDLDKWVDEIEDKPEANRIIFGEAQPSRRTLERHLHSTMYNHSRFSHLWRDGNAERPVDSDGQRQALITTRGLIAVTYPHMTPEMGPKICALYGARGLFILQPHTDVDGNHLGYGLVCGDCFIDGFENGKGIEIARRLGIEEEQFCLI